jgi:hypothetical protein
MKTGWFGWPIIGVVVLALLFSGAGQTWAEPITMVDFEDLGVAIGGQLVTPSGIGVVSRGFNYIPGPISGSSGFNDLHISNAEPFRHFNGTSVGGTHDDVILTKVGGETFSLYRFDFAGFLLNKEVPFEVTGVRSDSSTITQYFTPDGLVDGDVVGGMVDFQTFYLDGNWTNLKSVTWTHTGYEYGTDRGLFALDYIGVDQPKKEVPEPSTITLLGLGILCLLGQAWLGRKQLKALGDMA